MEKTSSTSEKKEKSHDGYISMYECSKNFCHSTYKRAFTATDITISKMEEFIENYKSDYEDIQYRLVILRELERHAADFEDAPIITVDSTSLILKENQSGEETTKRKIFR